MKSYAAILVPFVCVFQATYPALIRHGLAVGLQSGMERPSQNAFLYGVAKKLLRA